MKLSEWRKQKEKGEWYTLPSGLEARLRRVDLLDLAERGEIPAPLVGISDEWLGSANALTTQTIQRFVPVVNLVVAACWLEPRLSDEPGDDEISIDELDINDRIAIFTWSQGVAAVLRPFRPESGKPENPGRSGDEV